MNFTRFFSPFFVSKDDTLNRQAIDSSLNYLYERIEYLDNKISETVTIRKDIINLSILLKQSKKNRELDETHHKNKKE